MRAGPGPGPGRPLKPGQKKTAAATLRFSPPGFKLPLSGTAAGACFVYHPRMHRPLGNSTQQAHDRSLACCSWWYSAEFSFDEANTRAGDRDSGKSYGDFSRACRRAPSCELRSRRAPAALPTVADRPSSRGALSRMGASCSTQRPTSAPGLGAESSVSASMREGPVLTAGKAGKEEHWEDAESEVRSASGYAGHRATHEQRTTAVGLPVTRAKSARNPCLPRTDLYPHRT